MTTIIKLAWRNVWRNRRRTIITSLAIIASVAMLIFFNGLMTGFIDPTVDNNVELETGHIKVYPQGYREKSDLVPINMHVKEYEEIISAIKGVTGVDHAAPRIRAGGTLGYNKASSRVMINGIDPERDVKVRDLDKRVIQGQYLVSSDTNPILIGAALAKMLEVGLDDDVSLNSVAADGSVVSETFRIGGIFNTGFAAYDKTMIFIPLLQAQSILKIDAGSVTEVVVMTDRPTEASDVASAVSLRLSEQDYNYEVLDWEQLSPELVQFIEMERGMMSIVALIVVLIAAVSILNTMTMAIYERIRETGILAAFGFKSRDILFCFLFEGLIVGSIAAIVGSALGIGITQVASGIGITMPGAAVVEFMEATVYPRLVLQDILFPFFLAVGIAPLAALYPSYRASRMQPVEALRHV